MHVIIIISYDYSYWTDRQADDASSGDRSVPKIKMTIATLYL